MSLHDDRRLQCPDGTEIHYEASDPPNALPPAFLLIHGLGSNRTRWKRLAEEPFFRQRRLIIPDLRGHGDSVARRGIDIDGFVTDLEAVLKQEGAPRLVLIGHCLGANIAVRMWERNPRNVLALVLIEPFVSEALQGTAGMLHAVLRPIVRWLGLLARGVNALGVRRKHFVRINYSVYDEWVRPRLTNLFNVFRWMGPWMDIQCMPVASYADAYRVLFDYRPPWRKLDLPVLALTALQDGVLSPRIGGGDFDRPDIRRVELESSHFVLTDNREEVAWQIRLFVDGLQGSESWKS